MRTHSHYVFAILGVLAARHLTASADGVIALGTATTTLLPPLLRVVMDVMCVLAMCVCVARKGILLRPTLILVFILFVLIQVASSIGAMWVTSVDASPIRTIAGGRAWLMFATLLVLGQYVIPLDKVAVYCRALCIVGCVQVPISVVQYTQRRDSAYSGDYVTGLMGEYGSGLLAVFQCICIAVFVERRVLAGASILITVVGAGLLAAPIALAEATAGLALLPLVLIIVMLSLWRRGASRVAVIQVLGAVLILTPLIGWIYVRHVKGVHTSVVENLQREVRSRTLPRSGLADFVTRVALLEAVWRSCAETRWTFLFGYGMGYAGWSRLDHDGSAASVMRGCEGAATLLTDTLLDSGLLGAGFLVVLFMSLVTSEVRFLRMSSISAPQIAAAGPLVAGSVCFVCLLYNKSVLAPAVAWTIVPLLGATVSMPRLALSGRKSA